MNELTELEEQELHDAEHLNKRLDDCICKAKGKPYAGDSIEESINRWVEKNIKAVETMKITDLASEVFKKKNEKDDKLRKVFDQYGSGIKSYFKFLKTLCWIYLVLSCMVAPIAYIYAQHDGLEGMDNYLVTRFTMGNLGFANSLCYN